MLISLILTALIMGVVGGPHCLVMCGAACAGLGRAGEKGGISTLLIFHSGRLVGYGALGALAASSLQAVGWLGIKSVALRPLWTGFHMLALLLGLMLIWQAKNPQWLETSGKWLWQRVSAFARGNGGLKVGLLGMVWAFLPCGLLYSALMVAALAGNPLDGALVMVGFVLGTSVSLVLGPWVWINLNQAQWGDWGVRLAGVALSISALVALWLGLMHDQAPWCATPPVN